MKRVRRGKVSARYGSQSLMKSYLAVFLMHAATFERALGMGINTLISGKNFRMIRQDLGVKISFATCIKAMMFPTFGEMERSEEPIDRPTLHSRGARSIAVSELRIGADQTAYLW